MRGILRCAQNDNFQSRGQDVAIAGAHYAQLCLNPAAELLVRLYKFNFDLVDQFPL